VQPLKSVLLAVRARRIPVVAHLHIVHPLETRLYNALHQVALAVGVSEASVAGLREDGMDPARLRVIYNGVDPARLDGAPAGLRANIGLAPDDLVLVSVGSLIPRKGVDVLVLAMAELARTHRRAHLVLVGDGPQRAECERRAAAAGLAGRIHFLGEQTEVGPILRECDIAVSAARQEAFPLSLLEAAYCGLPIVASDIPPHEESVVRDVTGVLTPLDDPTVLAATLAALAGDGERRRAMGERGAARVRECFLLRHCIAAFEDAYAGLLAAPRSRYGWARGSSWPRAYWSWLGRAAARRVPSLRSRPVSGARQTVDAVRRPNVPTTDPEPFPHPRA
ncbi:MAG TPA: glycosyltransferase, partial [Gemmatimonadaceae bacterium]|nr:glycosyltransferase [Gemmatimonadaceae bacterium]